MPANNRITPTIPITRLVLIIFGSFQRLNLDCFSYLPPIEGINGQWPFNKTIFLLENEKDDRHLRSDLGSPVHD
jgi:hypothetical protein